MEREPYRGQPPPTSKDCGCKKFFAIKGAKLIQRGKEWTLSVRIHVLLQYWALHVKSLWPQIPEQCYGFHPWEGGHVGTANSQGNTTSAAQQRAVPPRENGNMEHGSAAQQPHTIVFT